MTRLLTATVLTVTAVHALTARLRDSGTPLGLDTGEGLAWPLLCILLAVCITQVAADSTKP